jgi:hypothetical protein
MSKSAKNRPKAMFLTEGGVFKQQRKAKKREKFIDGVFYKNKFYVKFKEVQRGALVKGDGVLHVFIKDAEICYEVVPVEELSVDQAEARFGDPRQIHRTKYVDREVLIAMFPDKAKIIQECNTAKVDSSGTVPGVSDLIEVVESYHLPSGKKKKDGKHTIVINSGELLAEEYTKQRFPYVKLGWSKRLNGYWSQSLAEQLQNLQLEINKTLWVIQRSMHMAGSFKVLIENGSKIVTEHLTNDIGAIINYNGTAPIYVTPPPIQQEYFQHLLNTKQLGFEQAGVSMLSAASMKPTGADSGKALRTLNDIESERFLAWGQAGEEFMLEVVEVTMDFAKDLAEIVEKDSDSETEFAVTYVGKNTIQKITWDEIAPDKGEEFVLKAYPVSQLPNEPRGRLATIQEYRQAGIIKPRTAKRLLDFPDLEQVEVLANAEEDYLNKILEDICDLGEAGYVPPDNFDDPQLAKELVLQYIAYGKLHNLDPDNMALLETFSNQIDTLVEKAMPPVDPMSPPQGAPEATPTSNLIPNNAGAVA